MKKCYKCKKELPIESFEIRGRGTGTRHRKDIVRDECKECFKEYMRGYMKKRRQKLKHDPKFKINHNMSGTLHKLLRDKKQRRHWETLVGYSVEILIKHLESLFLPGMTWENYGKWHIDHIIPISLFSFKDVADPEFIRCWSLENLQPLWAADNLKKGNRFISKILI